MDSEIGNEELISMLEPTWVTDEDASDGDALTQQAMSYYCQTPKKGLWMDKSEMLAMVGAEPCIALPFGDISSIDYEFDVQNACEQLVFGVQESVDLISWQEQVDRQAAMIEQKVGSWQKFQQADSLVKGLDESEMEQEVVEDLKLPLTPSD